MVTATLARTPPGRSTERSSIKSADTADWISAVRKAAIDKMLANISPPDGERGAVLASPSRQDPDYYYHWIRDAARTMGEIAVLAETGQRVSAACPDGSYHDLLVDYVEFSKINQTTPTISHGPGEPKFYVTGAAFNGPWGRPQNDGPAQRALILTRWANALLAGGRRDYVTGVLYDGREPSFSVIKSDLDFVGHHWRDPCFDLWEEVDGTHFYTRMLQRAALAEGAALATALDDPGAAKFYQAQAKQIEQQMEAFWSADRGYFLATIDRVGGLDYKASDLDTSVLIGSFQAYSRKFPFLAPDSDRILATAGALHDAFKDLYPINRTTQAFDGQVLYPGIGRYPEDRYTGGASLGQGNPWFLCTLAMGAVLYKASALLKKRDAITVSAENIAVFDEAVRLVDSSLRLRTGEVLNASSKAFRAVISGLMALGDAYLRRVEYHSGDDGSLSEQFDRDTGFMISARDLTWSYVAMIITANWRQEAVAAA